MFKLKDFVSQCVATSGEPDQVARVRDLMQQAIANPEELEAALPRITHDETLIHACPRMTIVLLRLTPNVHYPPHNHLMPVVIGVYRGSSMNTFYRRDGERLVVSKSVTLAAPQVFSIHWEAIHSVANHAVDYSWELHVYCGDLVRQPRTIWNPTTFETHPYSDEMYFELARPLENHRPYIRPPVPEVHREHLVAAD